VDIRRAVPILLYHSVSRDAAPPYRRFVVSPERFAEQMALLADGGFGVLPVTEYLARASAGLLPERPVVLTFDDGLADFHTEALPVLVRHGFRATLYLTTGLIGSTSRWLEALGEGSRPMMTWTQVAGKTSISPERLSTSTSEERKPSPIRSDITMPAFATLCAERVSHPHAPSRAD